MTNRLDLVKEGEAVRRRSILGEGRFALGLVVGPCVALVIWAATSIGDLELEVSEALQIVPSLGAMFVALASLLISYFVLSENRLMRQAGTDPVILVHLGSREDAPMLTTIEVRNVGAGAAMDVSFKVLGGAPDPTDRRIVTDIAKLVHTIRAIPQNHSVSYNFGTGYKLLGGDDQKPLAPIKLLVTYRDIEGSEYSNEQIIDVRELHFQQAHTPVGTRVAKSLEKISTEISQFTSEIKPIHVVTETKAQHEEVERLLNEELKKKFKE